MQHVYLGLVICVSTWSLYVSTYLKYEMNKIISGLLYPVFEYFDLNSVTLRVIKREFVFMLNSYERNVECVRLKNIKSNSSKVQPMSGQHGHETSFRYTQNTRFPEKTLGLSIESTT